MDPLLLALFVTLQIFQSLPSSTIYGRVTLGDADTPAANITIKCAARDRSTSSQTITDLDGRYRCVVLPGIYRVSASLPGDNISYLPQVFGANGPTDEGRNIRVHLRETVQADFVLHAAGSISGRVLDPDGAPIKNAVVTVSRDDGEAYAFAAESKAISIGESGRFSIGGMPSGLYRIYVDPPERGNTPDSEGRVLVRTWYPGVTVPQSALPLQIAEDSDLAGLDLTLLRARPIRIAGRVVRVDGSSRAGGRVTLVSRASARLSTESTTIDERGGFTFASIGPGEYELMVIVPGSPTESAYERLIVAGSDLTDLHVALRSTTSVMGRVKFEGGEFPRAGLTVITRGDSPAQDATARTNDHWEFELAGLPGPQLIRVADLPPGWSLKAVTTSGRDITNYAVDLGTGLSDVEIVISRAMSTLKGIARAADRELPPDSAIVLFSDEPSEWRTAVTTLRRVWPSADGRFVITGLAAGRYYVVAVDRMPSGVEQNQAAFLASVREQATPITLGERETVEIALTLRSYRE